MTAKSKKIIKQLTPNLIRYVDSLPVFWIQKCGAIATNLDPKCGAVAIIVIPNCGAIASNVAQNVEPLPLI